MAREDDVASAVHTAIMAKVGPRQSRLHVTWLPAGVVAIEGNVASLADKQLADAAARAAAGRTPVVNSLDVAVVPDDELTALARTAIHTNGVASLGVRIKDGIAILGGRAEGLEIVRKAREALSRVPGIRGIRHDRVVLHMDRDREEIERLAALEDWDILEGVRYWLAERLGKAKAARVVPICRNGLITLTGVVDRNSVRTLAEDAARKAYGVEAIRNLILTHEAPPPRAKSLERRIRQAIGRTTGAKPLEVRVHVVEEVAYLLGRVGHQEEAWQAMALAREEPGVRQVFDCLEIGNREL